MGGAKEMTCLICRMTKCTCTRTGLGAQGGEEGRSVDIIVNKAKATPAASLPCAFASLTSHRDRFLAPGESPRHLTLFQGPIPFHILLLD